MSASPDVDVAVIGAGVVGLAVAVVLSFDHSVAVIERHETFGRENSSHNSGVIHAGIYYPPGWLKTRLCIEGNPLLYAWAQRHLVKTFRIGKLIFAASEDELPTLDALFRAARANGVPNLKVLEKKEIRALEPRLPAHAAILSETSGVIDQMGLMRSFVGAAQAAGAHFAFNHEVMAVERRASDFLLRVSGSNGTSDSVSAAAVVSAAGLGADHIGEMLGYDPDGSAVSPRFRHTVNKGRYYDVVDRDKRSRFSHLIYPLPHSDRAGLGVHLTRDVDGGVHLGPDAEWLDSASELDFRADDDHRREFLDAGRQIFTDLSSEDIEPGQVGYRPKLHRMGEPPRDFLIWHDRGYVHLGGIESPGMTASLAIARKVASQIHDWRAEL